MRDFFKQLLKDLEVLTGYQQFNRLMDDPNGEQKCKRLLDELERASNQYGKIPEDLKQKRLERAIYSEDFKGITPRWVHMVLGEYWNNTYRQKYLHDEHQKELDRMDREFKKNPPDPEKVEEYKKQFYKNIAEAEKKYTGTYKGAGTRLKENWNKK